jgi:hypothetical protein
MQTITVRNVLDLSRALHHITALGELLSVS